jgi:hypothetical protein
MDTPAEIPVLLGSGQTEFWDLDVQTVAAHRRYTLTCQAPGGRRWTAEAGDVFNCLLDLRRQVEPEGIQLCCQGARRDAWSSGMQRDMGKGLNVYLLEGVPAGQRPPVARTLSPVAAELAVTVDDQLAWHQRWLASLSP